MPNLYINKLAKTTYRKLYKNAVNCRGKKLTPKYTLYELLLSNNPSFEHTLLEDYHITKTFNDVIDHIVNIYNSKKFTYDEEQYIDWNYNYDELCCKKLNNENIDVPIYVRFIHEDRINVCAAVEDRDLVNDKIIVTLNVPKIQDDQILYSYLLHEFLHAREMYSLRIENIMNSNKNMVADPDELNPFIWDSTNRVHEDVMILIYLLSNPECRARLNGVYRYIIEDNNMPNMNTHELVDYYVEKTNKVSSFSTLNIRVSTRLLMTLETGYYSTLEVYVYFFHKYKLIKTSLPSYSFKKMKKIQDYTKDEIDRITAAVFEILSLLLNFKHRLYNIIYKAIIDKK